MGDRYRTWIKDALWALVFAGVFAAVLRFSAGLGVATGLNDTTPWGLWIAFKLGFVALAGGGFTLAGMVYIFHLESYRPILRRAILLALLGYGSFIVSLIFDLGLPWQIYMPIIRWQHHSVMFEIAWCVLLYFSVLALEFSPAILEHPWFRHPIFQKILHILHLATVPLVIGGIVLSTLHQSSLGSLFLIMPHRVHPLWYSSWIPVLFFTSAIAAGLMALVLEGYLAEKWFKRGLQSDLLNRLAKISGFTLILYLVIRLGDLLARGVLPGALDGSWQSFLFLAEILVGGILPLIFLAIPKIRERREGLLTIALLVMAGVVSQRMALSLFTMWRPEGAAYKPSFTEVVIAFAIPAAAVLIYLFFTENLAVLEKERLPREAELMARPQFNPLAEASQADGLGGILARRTGLAVMVIALMMALAPVQPASSQELPASPVRPALGWETLIIDGNLAGYAVYFPHVEHQERLAEKSGSLQAACTTCHHLNRPSGFINRQDMTTACWECHSDYSRSTNIFNHTSHQERLRGNASCTECHTGEHSRSTAVACVECHDPMTSGEEDVAFNYLAPPYPEALHGKCQTCHEQEAAARDQPELALCSTCHTAQESQDNQQVRLSEK